jgi:hypothetical protein
MVIPIFVCLVGEIISSGNPKLYYKIRTKSKYSFASIYNQIVGVQKILANQEIDVKILLSDWLFQFFVKKIYKNIGILFLIPDIT